MAWYGAADKAPMVLTMRRTPVMCSLKSPRGHSYTAHESNTERVVACPLRSLNADEAF